MLTGTEIDSLYPYNKKVVCTVPEAEEYLHEATGMYRESLVKQIIEKREDKEIRLRPSLMGKAAIDVLARKHFPSLYGGGVSHPRFYQVFHDGGTWESDYYLWLSVTGVKVLETQVETTWYDIDGHGDFLVELPTGKRVFLELKTSNDGWYKSMLNMQKADMREFRYGSQYRDYEHIAHTYSDFRGHMTQGSIYSQAKKVDEVVIVLKDKSTSNILLYNLTQDERHAYLKRAEAITDAWDSSDTWAECFMYVGIPTPRKEISKGSHTGRYLVAPALYGSPIIPLVYEWTQEWEKGKPKIIINGYRMPEDSLPMVHSDLMAIYNELGVWTYSMDDIENLLLDWKDAKE